MTINESDASTSSASKNGNRMTNMLIKNGKS